MLSFDSPLWQVPAALCDSWQPSIALSGTSLLWQWEEEAADMALQAAKWSAAACISFWGRNACVSSQTCTNSPLWDENCQCCMLPSRQTMTSGELCWVYHWMRHRWGMEYSLMSGRHLPTPILQNSEDNVNEGKGWLSLWPVFTGGPSDQGG